MSFIRKSKEPPKLQTGETVEATILDIKYPVKSKKFNRDNVEFRCKLNDSYECRAWVGYYEEPSDKSELAKLILTLMRITKQDFKNVKEGLEALRNYGRIFLKFTGYNQRGNLSYPKFKLVTDVLPNLQTQLEQRLEGTCPNCKQRVTPEARFCPNCGTKLV